MRAWALLLLLWPGLAAAQGFCLCLKCATGAFRSYTMTAESMAPTLRVGQCLITATRFDPATLVPGTVITYRQPGTGTEFAKRIVATGGQQVQMVAGALHIDGAPVPRTRLPDRVIPFARQGGSGAFPLCANAPVAPGGDCVTHRWAETLGGMTYETLDVHAGPLDDTVPVTVPAGHLFVLGDHRDNSRDSRLPASAGGAGFVAVADVTGILQDIRP